MLTALYKALTPTDQELELSDRVERHTDILRGLAHELSSAPEREDRPRTGEEASARVAAYLDRLSFELARDGAHAPTANFVDGLVVRYDRYKEHLFHCFDDPRIPATTNSLEGFFGASKRATRQTLGCGSTSNSVVTNLGDDALLAYHYIRCPNRRTALAKLSAEAEEFDAARSRISEKERPATERRSRVRNLGAHLDRLRCEWSGLDPG